MKKYEEFKMELAEKVDLARFESFFKLITYQDLENPQIVVQKIFAEVAPKYLPSKDGKYPKLLEVTENRTMKVEFPDGNIHETKNMDTFLELWEDYVNKTEHGQPNNRVRGFEPVKGAPADTKMPTRGTSKSAGYDFYAPEDIVVPPRGYSKIVFLNVKAYMPDDEFLGLAIRSSMATTLESVFDDKGKVVKPESHLITAQGFCVIDSDYYSNADNDGNIGVMFYNFGDKPRMIKKGERCCQGIFMKYGVADNDVSQGVREGGYGSTGK